MPDQQGFSYADWANVSSAGYVQFTVGASALDASSRYFPSKGTLSHVEVQLRTINPVIGAAGCPTKVYTVATWDSAGLLLALPETAPSVSPVPGSTASGGIVLAADVQYQQPAASDQNLYVSVKLDAGAAQARVRVFWRK